MDDPGPLPTTASPPGGHSGEDTNVSFVTCDRCNSNIKGARYKCLACPDFDYCSVCYSDASLIHPGHDFLALNLLSTSQDVRIRNESELQVHDDIAPPSPSPPRAHRLCRSCEPITKPLPAIHLMLDDPRLKSKVREPLREISLLWPVRISHLVEATQRGCAFCAFIMDRFFFSGSTQFYGYAPVTPWYAQPLKHNDRRQSAVAHCMRTLTRFGDGKIMFHVTPSCRRIATALPDFDRLIIGVDTERSNMDLLKKANVFRLVGKLEIEVDIYAAKGTSPAQHLSSRPPNATPLSAATFEQVKEWISHCDHHHQGICMKKESQILPKLPTRVIQVGADGHLRLYESAPEEQGRYIALSYCWGGPQHFQTLNSTLAERIAGFSVESLPQTLQDAVRVTQQLGIPYLWVDSICIIQDSVKDKSQEVSKMAEIYKQAYLTICAEKAYKADDGFLKDCSDPITRLWPSLVPMDYPSPNRDTRDIEKALRMESDSIEKIWLMGENNVAVRWFPDPVSRRGWCLQERILSPRLLSYGRWPMWTCNGMSRSDGGFYIHDDKDRLYGRLAELLLQSPKAQSGIQSLDLLGTVQLYQAWYRVLKDYTKREFRFSSDKLPGIGGIAAEISRITGARYAAGLWEQNLLHDLMWFAKTLEWCNRPGTWRAPTWSWAAVECPISYSEVTDDVVPLASVGSCDVALVDSESPFGEVKEGTIEVSGPFARIDRNNVQDMLRHQALSPSPPKSNSVDEWTRLQLEDISSRPRDEHREREEALDSLPEEVFALLLFRRSWIMEQQAKQEKTCYFGILLKESEKQGGCFERIGCISAEVASWLDQEGSPWDRRTLTIV